MIVLVNSAQGSMAYFAFTDDELDSGSKISNQTQPVYPQAFAQTGDLLVGRQDDGNNTPSSTEWKVEDMFRGMTPRVSLSENLQLTGGMHQTSMFKSIR